MATLKHYKAGIIAHGKAIIELYEAAQPKKKGKENT